VSLEKMVGAQRREKKKNKGTPTSIDIIERKKKRRARGR